MLKCLLICIDIFQKHFDYELLLFNPNGNPGGFRYLYPYLLDEDTEASRLGDLSKTTGLISDSLGLDCRLCAI